MSPIDDQDPPRHSDDACTQLLTRLLLPPSDLLTALAPDGWERSPLVLICHPTEEQCRSELESWRRNSSPLRGGIDTSSQTDEQTVDVPETPVEPEREVVDLIGAILWDVFSDNHSVVDDHGTEFDLGSFRGSAGFIAESINNTYPSLDRGLGYLDFYMGTWHSARRADLRPVYRWVFSRLREAGCNWRFTFPRVYLFSVGHEPQSDDPLTYDPSEAVRAALEEDERAKATRKLQEDLERSHQDAVEEARNAPPPTIVLAYRDVYGAFPVGWPP
jgi:hypothetical protein